MAVKNNMPLIPDARNKRFGSRWKSFIPFFEFETMVHLRLAVDSKFSDMIITVVGKGNWEGGA
jgi:hypothetical protein